MPRPLGEASHDEITHTAGDFDLVGEAQNNENGETRQIELKRSSPGLPFERHKPLKIGTQHISQRFGIGHNFLTSARG